MFARQHFMRECDLSFCILQPDLLFRPMNLAEVFCTILRTDGKTDFDRRHLGRLKTFTRHLRVQTNHIKNRKPQRRTITGIGKKPSETEFEIDDTKKGGKRKTNVEQFFKQGKSI